jgi:hypothetical protein
MKVCSIFSQVLKLFSRGGFEKAVKQHKGRTTRAGLHQLGPVHCDVVLPGGKGAFPARDLWGLACCEGQLKHLGVPVAPKRSTLAYEVEVSASRVLLFCCPSYYVRYPEDELDGFFPAGDNLDFDLLRS